MLVTLEFDNKTVGSQLLVQTLHSVTKVRLVKLIYTASYAAYKYLQVQIILLRMDLMDLEYLTVCII